MEWLDLIKFGFGHGSDLVIHSAVFEYLYAATVGWALGSMGGSGYSQPRYREVDIGDATFESLLAQTEVAKPMFDAESDENFGRPAYARLDRKIAIDGLLGEEVKVDSDGYARTVIRSSIPQDSGSGYIENDFHAILKSVYPERDLNFKDTDEDGIDADPLSGMENLDAFFGQMNYTDAAMVQGYFNYHPRFGKQTYETGLAYHTAKNGDAFYSDNMQEYFDGTKDKEIKEILQKYGYEIPERGTAYNTDGEVLAEKVEFKEEFIGLDKAGQTVRTGGGLLDFITGGKPEMLPRADGSEGREMRKAGHDKDGNFLGLNKVQQDLDNSNNAAKIQSELRLITENADKFTEAYRSQGDIKVALDNVKTLAEGFSARPSGEINSGGTALFDYATGKTTDAPSLDPIRNRGQDGGIIDEIDKTCLLYTSPSPRD